MISAPKSYLPRLLPLRLPRVCVAVSASDAAELIEKAEGLIRDNPFIELRLDYLSKPVLALPKIKHFMEANAGITVIATCRRAAAGGKFRGSIASQLDILAKAANAGLVHIYVPQRLDPYPSAAVPAVGTLSAANPIPTIPAAAANP